MDFNAMTQGPRDPSLLHLQSTHRSKEIWRVGGGDSQRCRRRNPNQIGLPALDQRMIPLLQSTGFYGISRVSSLQLDWSLISALVERWRPETHTFHLPMGECTITLQDVGVILGLPIDGKPVICDASPGPNMSWADYVGSVFGSVPPPNRFNGSRIYLSWFASTTARILRDDASDADVLHHTRCYLIQLMGGSLFTDHSGGLIHPMWVRFVADLATCGEYAWGPAVLSFLYRELCKGCKVDVEEVAGCLLLLQLWAWERLPTLAPIRTSQRLVDDQFWTGHLPGPLGMRWLVGHSFLEKAGRTVSGSRAILDELAPSHFIWEPYSADVIDSLPPYCLTGRHLWRYCGPMICIFIVEPHLPDRVARQFGMIQSIPVDPIYSSDHHNMTLKGGNAIINWSQKHQPSIAIWDTRLDHVFQSALIVSGGDATVPDYLTWYLDRTVRFISRLGALHVYLGGLFKTIAERTESVLPDVSLLAVEGLTRIQDRSLYGFDAFPLEERRDKEQEGRKDPGRRPKRARGGGGGRGAGRQARRRVGDEPVEDEVVLPIEDQVVPPVEQDQVVDHEHDQGEDNNAATKLGDDLDPLVHEGNYIDEAPFDVPELPTDDQTAHGISKTKRHPNPSYPSFDLGLTPTPTPAPEPDQQQQVTTQQHPPLQPTNRPPKNPILSYPTFDLGITPPSDDVSASVGSQSTESSQLPLTQASDSSNVDNPSDSARAVKSLRVYEPRRSKRVRKPPSCGTDGEKCKKK